MLLLLLLFFQRLKTYYEYLWEKYKHAYSLSCLLSLSFLFISKSDFDIKQPMKSDMPWRKKLKRLICTINSWHYAYMGSPAEYFWKEENQHYGIMDRLVTTLQSARWIRPLKNHLSLYEFPQPAKEKGKVEPPENSSLIGTPVPAPWISGESIQCIVCIWIAFLQYVYSCDVLHGISEKCIEHIVSFVWPLSSMCTHVSC